MKKLRYTFILVFFFVYLAPNGLSQTKKDLFANTLKEYAQSLKEQSFLGNYMGGKKVGWDSEISKIILFEGKESLKLTQQSYFIAKFAGQKSVSQETIETIYSLDGQGDILQVNQFQNENGFKKTKKLFMESGKYFLKSSFDKSTQQKEVSKPKENLSTHLKLVQWLNSELKPGSEFSCHTTALEEDDFNVPTKFIFKKYEIQEKDGTRGYPVVDQITHGAIFTSILDYKANVIHGRMGNLLELRKETEIQAKKIPEPLVDLMEISSIKLDKPLGDPRSVEFLRLQVQATNQLEIPESHRQMVKIFKKDIYEVILLKDYFIKQPFKLPFETRKLYLQPTNNITSDSQKITKMAKEIIGETKGEFEKAAKLCKWVYGKLDKTMAANSESALEVLSKMKGDCTEHSLLFVTLARSIGIPAREVGGLAYMDSDPPRLAWHAWAEIYDGKQWITCDPTWNQVLVDATHWKFSEGPTDMNWLNVLGGLQVKVKEFKKSDPNKQD